MRRGIVGFASVFALLSCKEATVPVGPIDIQIVNATPTSLQLKNAGGDGTYVVEIWGRLITNNPTGCNTSQLIEGHCPATAVKVAELSPVVVTAGYEESRPITGTGMTVYGFKVFSRPTNVSQFTQTDCARAVTGAWLTFPCP